MAITFNPLSGKFDIVGSGGGGGGGITSINGDSTAAQLISAGNGINVSSTGGTTTITNDAIFSINGNNTQAQTIVSGGGITVSSINGVTTLTASGGAASGPSGSLQYNDFVTPGDFTGDPGITTDGGGNLTVGSIIAQGGAIGSVTSGITNTDRLAYTNYDYETGVTSGGSLTVPDGISLVVLNAAATLTTYTITLPEGPQDGMVLYVTCNQAQTATTFLANAGQTITGGSAVAIPLGSAIGWIFVGTDSNWYPL